MVYLIGCDHRAAQSYPDGSSLTDPQNWLQKDFKDYVLGQIARWRPTIIAEEMHSDALQAVNRRSVVAEAANETCTQHLYADPNWVQRDYLRIQEALPFLGPCPSWEWEQSIRTVEEALMHDIAHRWPIREKFWINELGERIREEILFICGAGHRETFRHRLRDMGLAVRVLQKRFGAKPLSQDHFKAYQHVRRRGFPPATGCFCSSPRSKTPMLQPQAEIDLSEGGE